MLFEYLKFVVFQKSLYFLSTAISCELQQDGIFLLYIMDATMMLFQQ